MQLDALKSHDSAYDEDDELPPINGKMKPSKYSMAKPMKPSQPNGMYGGNTSSTFKPKSIAPVNGSNGSSTNRSGVYQDSMSTAAKVKKSSNVGAQLPLKKVNASSSKPKKLTGAISSSGSALSSSTSFGEVAVAGTFPLLEHCRSYVDLV
jgi:hypothetical protein